MNKELNEKIIFLRKLKGHSQEFIANKLNISQKAYSKIECGNTKLNWDRLNQIAAILKVNIWDLVNTKKDSKDRYINSDNNIFLLNKLIHQYENKILKLENEVQNLKELLNKESF